MQLAGTSSWRLDVTDGRLFELALFVSEAAGLNTANRLDTLNDDIPSLIGSVPDVTGVLDPVVSRDALDQWRSWWEQIVEFEFRDRQHDQGDARARAQRRIAEHHAVCDPPSFQALGSRPALQAAATASFSAFQHWESARPSPAREGKSRTPLDWSLITQTAEDVAFDRQVDLGAVQASVAVVRVQGIWWRRVFPGCALFSAAAGADLVTAQVLLRDAFESHLANSA